MASSTTLFLSQLPLAPISTSRSLLTEFSSSLTTTSSSSVSSSNSYSHKLHSPTLRKTNSSRKPFSISASSAALQALIFDCDGVILESEHLHRQAYNDAFAHFNVRCPPSSSQPLNWSSDFYDVLQNQIGGGKPKMRWCVVMHYFLLFSFIQLL